MGILTCIVVLFRQFVTIQDGIHKFERVQKESHERTVSSIFYTITQLRIQLFAFIEDPKFCSGKISAGINKIHVTEGS